MDGTGNFSGLADVAASDAGIEPPAAIGNDERRMHVRAYNYWVSLLEGRAYPSIEDLDPENLSDFGPHSVLLDFTGGIEDPSIAFLGNALRTECDLPVGVNAVSEIPSRSLLSRLTDHYLQIIANRAPIGFEAEYENERGNNTMYRGILMPFSSDDDTIDFIYGVINWKEVADQATTDAIEDEVERAIAASPRRRPDPVPVWADGPSAHPVEDTPRIDDNDDEIEIEAPQDCETLGDWLAAARATAEVAAHSESRSRAHLYRALSLSYDFSLVAAARPDDYAELLADSRIVPQARAPMTPIIKLVFGATYDKTRIAEYALALAHGQRVGLAQGALFDYLEAHPGGLKGVVYAERAERKPAPRVAPASDAARERARAVQPLGVFEHSGTEEFVVLIARRLDAGHVAILGAVADDQALLDKALRNFA